MPLTNHLVLPLPAVPGARPAPTGMDLVEQEFANGLPGRVPLTDDLVLVVSAPTGALRLWMDLPADTTVYDSAVEARPVDPASPGPSAAEALPLRLYMMSGTKLLAAAPLRLGKRMLLPETGAPLLELVLLSAVVTAGAVRGLPLSGARVRLAWRRVGRSAGNPRRGEVLPPTQAPASVTRRLGFDLSSASRRRRT
jgi:hypothetical protein